MTDHPPALAFSQDDILRYSRHILLPEIGGTGQEKLLDTSVLIIGAGGLGSPIALYLAAAGIGRIGIVDHDHVELSNLQRQILFETRDVGRPKATAATERLHALNPALTLEPHLLKATPDNLDTLIRSYDIVCDGSDNFSTRYAVSDACVRQKRTLVSGAVQRFEGQLSTFRPHRGGPCYRCLFPDATPEDAASCATAGILGAVTGVIGTLAATEILKELLDLGESLSGRVLTWDALSTAFRSFTLTPDPTCPSCGHR